MAPAHIDGNPGYCMFEYYESLDIQPVKGIFPLLDGYKSSRRISQQDKAIPSRQILLAFTDVQDGTGNSLSQATGFTREEIDHFWEDRSQPILFMTMINVGDYRKILHVAKNVKKIYPKGRYLIYYTLDYCDIIIFFRGRSFQQCAELIFKLDYDKSSNGARLVDSITLYALDKDFDLSSVAPSIKEHFGVYLRFGVADAARMEQFCEELENQTKGNKFSRSWILGRYDIGIFNPQANLEWLLTVKRLLDRLPEQKEKVEGKDDAFPWYTIHTLFLFIEPTEIPLNGRLSFKNVDIDGLHEKIMDTYSRFESVYQTVCSRLNVPEDGVWLRWLKDAFAQAVSFLFNNMTSDLGVCLVPQFLDFFTYAQKLWGSDDFGLKHLEDAEEAFFTLFTNVSVLIDSINHSSRQFIMTPSFRTLAFDMPPKIMAYYIAVAHRLVDVFRDDDVNNYGFIISPKFARELDVTSLAQQDVVGRDQFSTIGIEETSLYQLQHTTVTLAHEISHQVGDKNRNRSERKRCVLLAELHNILNDLALKLHNALVRQSGRINKEAGVVLSNSIPKENEVYIPWGKRDEVARSLLEILGEYAPEYTSETEKCYKRELTGLLRRLPHYLRSNPNLVQILFEFLWESLVMDEEGVTYLGRTMSVLMRWYSGNEEKAGELDFKDIERLLSTMVKPLTRELFQTLLLEYADKYEREIDAEVSRQRDICDLFSETYADLQALLLFDLDWAQYCELFCRTTRSLQETDLPRLLGITVTLFAEGDLPVIAGERMTEHFERIWQLAKRIREPSDMERFSADIAEQDFDPAVIYYLMQYLPRCAKDIRAYLKKPIIKKKALALTKIYDDLSDMHGIYQLLTSLMAYIADYRTEVCGKLTNSVDRHP